MTTRIGSRTRKISGASVSCPRPGAGTRSSGQPKAMAPANDASASVTVVRASNRMALARSVTPSPPRREPRGPRRRSAVATSSTVSQRCGAQDAGDLRRERRRGDQDGVGRAIGDDLAVGHDEDAVGDRRHELDIVGRQQHGVTGVGEVAQDRRQVALGGVVEAARRLVEQDDRGSAASWIARTTARRWPADRSRGCISSGTPATSRSRIDRHVRAPVPDSRSACRHSAPTVSR